MTDPKQQRLLDALQVAALSAQRIVVTSQQQARDAAALIDATERAVALVQRTRPGDAGEKGGDR